MASAWGKAFGVAFGGAWGAPETVQPTETVRWLPGGGSGGHARTVRKHLPLEKTRQQRQNEQLFLLLMQ